MNLSLGKLIEPLRLCKKRTRNSLEGVQVASKAKAKSLDVYKRGFGSTVLYRRSGQRFRLT